LARLEISCDDRIWPISTPAIYCGWAPIRSPAIAALGSAIYHVHAKDTLLEPETLALEGRIEIRPAEDFTHRAWNYVTLGRGHDETWWRRFCQALAAIGYGDVLSIEHEDLALPPIDGVKQSVALLRRVMPGGAACGSGR
jgi:sugar phosphate isomerase/epimerase